jgi:hypothetical protein
VPGPSPGFPDGAVQGARRAERVERLFQIIRSSARRVSLSDQSRTGYGLPDVLVAVGLQTQAGRPPCSRRWCR